MERDLAFGEEEDPLSRGPSGPLRSSKSGKPEAKRMERDLAGSDEGNPLSRGPSGPLRSSKSGQNQTTSVATTHSASTDLTNTKRTAVGNLRLPTIAAP